MMRPRACGSPGSSLDPGRAGNRRFDLGSARPRPSKKHTGKNAGPPLPRPSPDLKIIAGGLLGTVAGGSGRQSPKEESLANRPASFPEALAI